MSGTVASRPPHCTRPPLEDQEVRWINVGPDEDGNYLVRDFLPPGQPSPESDYWVAYCPYHINAWQNDINWEPFSGWSATGNPPPTPPTGLDVRDALWAQVTLYAPTLALDPDQANRSVLNVPTFVEITNPQISTLYTATVQGVFAWIAVIPNYTLHPGEPGAPGVPCDEDGTAYVEGGGTPDDQAAAANGCVYTYTQRSAGWNGNVTIAWDIQWGSNQAAYNGQPPLVAAPSVGGFNRIVDEVQTVVGDGTEDQT